MRLLMPWYFLCIYNLNREVNYTNFYILFLLFYNAKIENYYNYVMFVQYFKYKIIICC